jgi:hypothetical protein
VCGSDGLDLGMCRGVGMGMRTQTVGWLIGFEFADKIQVGHRKRLIFI